MKIPHNANRLYNGVLVDIYKIPEIDGLWVEHKEGEIKQIESDDQVHVTIVDLLSQWI